MVTDAEREWLQNINLLVQGQHDESVHPFLPPMEDDMLTNSSQFSIADFFKADSDSEETFEEWQFGADMQDFPIAGFMLYGDHPSVSSCALDRMPSGRVVDEVVGRYCAAFGILWGKESMEEFLSFISKRKCMA